MKKEIRVKFSVDVTDDVQDFLAKLFEREAEKALLKTWKKVFGGETEEELKARSIVIQDPSIWFENDGNCERIATPGDTGRETAVGAPGEPEDDLTGKVRTEMERAGLRVDADGIVTDPSSGYEVAGPI